MQAIWPKWPVPDHIKAFTTTRIGGVSQFPFYSFNLAQHVGDNPADVEINRELLIKQFQLPSPPLYLNQIHSTRVIQLPYDGMNIDADAVYTDQPNQVCAVMTADCLPLLVTNQAGTEIAAIHAGWRGLCNGIIEETIKHFKWPQSEIYVWLGPAISQKAFQVGEEVLAQFSTHNSNAVLAFKKDENNEGKYFADLYELAKQRLYILGINNIFGGEHCTFCENEIFFSYRKEKETGRILSVIWNSSVSS